MNLPVFLTRDKNYKCANNISQRYFCASTQVSDLFNKWFKKENYFLHNNSKKTCQNETAYIKTRCGIHNVLKVTNVEMLKERICSIDSRFFRFLKCY